MFHGTGKPEMNKRLRSLIVFGELAGFLFAILVVWVDEVADLPHFLFNAPKVPARFEEALWESAFVLIICCCVIATTLWMLRRITRLESYIEMCAWCRKIKVEKRWISFESYLSEKDKLTTTHGLCEACAEKQLAAIEGREMKKR
jgi:hypothetical protein